jgi:hypothetical protein
VVEGARLESVYRVTPYRGFESHPLRHLPVSDNSSQSNNTKVCIGFLGLLAPCPCLAAPMKPSYDVGNSVGEDGIGKRYWKAGGLESERAAMAQLQK